MGRYKIVALGRQLNIGVAGSRNATVSAFAKANSQNAPYCVPNEMICAPLAQVLGLPMPPHGIMVDANSGTEYFASLDFNLQGVALPPVDVAHCVSTLPWESTGLLLFDALVANADRHRNNFSVDTSITPPVMNIFDHSHALFGWVPGHGAARLAGMAAGLAITGGHPTGGNRHCLLDAIDTDAHFDEWFDRIDGLQEYHIKDVCNSAIGHGIGATEAQQAIYFLTTRKTGLRDLVKRNRAEFRGVRTWSIFT